MDGTIFFCLSCEGTVTMISLDELAASDRNRVRLDFARLALQVGKHDDLQNAQLAARMQPQSRDTITKMLAKATVSATPGLSNVVDLGVPANAFLASLGDVGAFDAVRLGGSVVMLETEGSEPPPHLLMAILMVALL
jgi:hypothetical protein